MTVGELGAFLFLGMPASPTRYATPPCRLNRSRTCGGRARRIRSQNTADAGKGPILDLEVVREPQGSRTGAAWPQRVERSSTAGAQGAEPTGGRFPRYRGWGEAAGAVGVEVDGGRGEAFLRASRANE